MIRTTRKFIRHLALVSALSCGLSAAASNSETITLSDRALAAVKTLQPRLTDLQAKRMTKALLAVQKAGCVVTWQVLLSIAYTESSLRRDAVGQLNPRTKDYGLMQINAKTAERLGLDKARLMADERYAFAAGCMVLKGMKEKYANRHPYWIGLYRAGTAVSSPTTVRIAKTYHGLIMARATRLGHR